MEVMRIATHKKSDMSSSSASNLLNNSKFKF